MTQHRVYFTETEYGYIVCDSKEDAEKVQQGLDDGLPLDEVDGYYIKYTGGEREHNYKVVN